MPRQCVRDYEDVDKLHFWCHAQLQDHYRIFEASMSLVYGIIQE